MSCCARSYGYHNHKIEWDFEVPDTPLSKDKITCNPERQSGPLISREEERKLYRISNNGILIS
ncbi:hypothetical protein STEG23_025068, partial [Scotinomys teguina]